MTFFLAHKSPSLAEVFWFFFPKKERLALSTFAVAQAVADAGFGGDDGGELGAEFAAELADIDA
jgi:hypothetical protein